MKKLVITDHKITAWLSRTLPAKHRSPVFQLICILLVILWSYAALSKLSDYEESRRQMLNQVFPVWMAEVLTWLVPLTELLLALSLLWKRVQRKALLFSRNLLLLFTAYIAITMSNAFGRIPCSCGGILKDMGYWTHFFFNLFFVALSAIAIKLNTLIREGERTSRQKGGAVTTMT